MENIRLVRKPIDSLATAEMKHRLFGLRLFAAYLAVYAGFIGIATFRHEALPASTLFGLNLAVLYGFGLIAFAFVLSLVFLVAGNKKELP